MTGPLTDDQVQRYRAEGFLVVDGLLPEAISATAARAIWTALGRKPDDSQAWARVPPAHTVYDSPELIGCYTTAYLHAAAQLSDDDPTTFQPPRRAFAINVFPQQGTWKWPAPHIDHAIKEHGHHVFPPAFRIAAMTFLSDCFPHGGGTVVWPGSHKKLEAIAKAEPARYELMWSLNQDLASLDLGSPMEIVPRCGDILFYHYLCAHAGSKNVSNRPRLALNMKW